MKVREIRCQCVLLVKDKILVAKHYNYINNEEFWLLPGGGIEENETMEECIVREMKEETNLDVEIIEVLSDIPFIEKSNNSDSKRNNYMRYVTFLCRTDDISKLKVGSESRKFKKIIDLIWCSIDSEESWNQYLIKEDFFPSMREIREQLLCLKK